MKGDLRSRASGRKGAANAQQGETTESAGGLGDGPGVKAGQEGTEGGHEDDRRSVAARGQIRRRRGPGGMARKVRYERARRRGLVDVAAEVFGFQDGDGAFPPVDEALALVVAQPLVDALAGGADVA